ncbi:hypothetical protein F4818DRAFT_198576 [Hypoxylon cercidicola]|nr:hypothetical protein F4818DRAFT_198576 [Hypoxylon cercidicola]
MTWDKVTLMSYPEHSTLTSTKPRISSGKTIKRMATNSPVQHPSQIWSLDNLSTELLVLIFKQLRDIDSRTLASARQLSRRLESIIAPIQFDTFHLNERIITPHAETHSPRLCQYLYTYTKHVHVRSDLDPENTARVLDRIQRLSSLRWRYVGFRPHPGSTSRPSCLLSPNHIRANEIKLYVEDLPFVRFDYDFHDAYLQAFPARNIVSLKMKSPAEPFTTRLESVKHLLLQTHQIETFHYSDRGQGTQFSFEGNERLPAFKDLLLRSYDWNHDTVAFQKHWDFSRLRDLTLIDVPLFNFLSSVPSAELRQLRTLHCEDFTTHLLDKREEVSVGLYMLAKQIHSLHILKVTCHTELFPVDGILHHADSLRTLSFRDYVGFDDETRPCPTMRAEDLAQLSTQLVNLHTAELDMDAQICEPQSFLCALCGFPRLETLVLHTQTVLRIPDDGVYYRDGTDADYEAAARIVSALVQGKRGRPWLRVTINVGGWKPVMVRRVGTAWREWNRRGVYAERCFVLERDAGDGAVTLREEMGSTSD